MRLAVLLLAVLAASPAAALPRVFLAPLRATGVDAGVSDLVGEQLLVSARRHKAVYDVVGAADVKGILDVNAARAALGCDTDSCANEVADALDADQLLTGQLGHVGEVWLLTLTRTDRKTLQVLARASVEASGSGPEVLLSRIPELVDEALGVVQPINGWLYGGVGVAGAGALAAASGGVLIGLSWVEYGVAEGALAASPPDVSAAKDAQGRGELFYPFGLVLTVSGGVLVAVGVTTAVLAALPEE